MCQLDPLVNGRERSENVVRCVVKGEGQILDEATAVDSIIYGMVCGTAEVDGCVIGPKARVSWGVWKDTVII